MSRELWAQSYSSGWNMSRSLASIHSIIYQGEPIHKFCKFVSKIFFEGEMVSLSCARIWLLKTIWNIFVVRTEDKLRSNFCYIFIIFFKIYLRRTFQRWIWKCYQRIVRVSLLYDEWSFYKEKVFFSPLFISDSSVQPFRKWTLKQSIQNTWVKSEESLFYIRPGTDNFTLRLLNDSPTRWLTSAVTIVSPDEGWWVLVVLTQMRSWWHHWGTNCQSSCWLIIELNTKLNAHTL